MKKSSVREIQPIRRLAIATILACLSVATSSAGELSPDEVIEEAVELLTNGLDERIEELKGDKDELYEFIDSILLPRFDRKFAAVAVLAKHWRTASDEQKQRFINAFYTTLVRRYAEGILEFDMDRIVILPYKGNPKKRTTVVKTRVQLDDGTKIPVFYTLVNNKGKWRMFDVKIEGVSYVVNYRKELDAEIRRTSLDQVIKRLESSAGFTPDE